MKIKTEHYSIYYDKQTETAIFNGSLRLSETEEYDPILQLLNEVANTQSATITINLRQLEFLNSSGINVLSKFVIKVRQIGTIHMVVLGSKEIPWQGKSLKNLQRLMPSLDLVLE
jgi:hypothetical protein